MIVTIFRYTDDVTLSKFTGDNAENISIFDIPVYSWTRKLDWLINH